MNLQQLINTLLGAAPEVGKGVVRGVTADVVGAPVDTLNAVRQGLLAPAEAGNPYARQLGGLLGPVQQTGSSDYFAQQMGLPAGHGMAYEAGRMLSPSPSDLMSLARRAPSIQELITYHGTPHQFPATEANPLGEFDASKIGTGEGAQAYGHGVYLAEAPEVAQEYRNRLSTNVTVDGSKLKSIPSDSPLAEAHNMVVRNIQSGMSPDEAISATRKYWIDAAEEMKGFAKNNPELAERIAKESENRMQVAEAASSLKPQSFYRNPGSLYTADLPDEMIDKMLDWDKPFLDQSQEIKDLARNMLPPAVYNQLLTQRSGDFVEELAKYKGGKAKASELMRQAGITGIKYLDRGSRGEGKGTRNFVVFPGEEKKVKILKRD